MAKRVRGSGRPAGRRPAPRSERPANASRPAGAPQPAAEPVRNRPVPSAALTPEEVVRAAQIEERIVAEERAAEEAERRRRNRGRVADVGRTSEPLSVRAAQEYAYVRRDVVRIAWIGGGLLAVVAVLHVLINVTGTISI